MIAVMPYVELTEQEIIEEVDRAFLYRQLDFYYSIFHIVVAFWLPAVVILICYALIIWHLHVIDVNAPIPTSNGRGRHNSVLENATSIPLLAMTGNATGRTAGMSRLSSSQNTQRPSTLVLRNAARLPANISSGYGTHLSPMIPIERNRFPPRSPSNPGVSFAKSLSGFRQKSQTVSGMRVSRAREVGSRLERPLHSSADTIRTQGREQPAPNRRQTFADITLGRAKSKTMRKAIFILFAYIVCWSPYNIIAVWNMIHPEGVEAAIGTNIDFLYNLIVVNAILNPLIYGISL